MAGARTLEELEVWKTARGLVRRIYEVTTSPEIRRDYGFRDQIRRAAVGIMSNIAEGFGRSTDRDFARFLDSHEAQRWKHNLYCTSEPTLRIWTKTHPRSS